LRATVSSKSTLSNIIAQLRWVVPITISLIGLFYVFYHSYIDSSHVIPHTKTQLISGVILLSIVGPLTAFIALSWALRAAVRFEQAEQILQRDYQQTEALNRVAQAVNQSLNLKEILDLALENVLDIMALTSGTIWIIDGDHMNLEVVKGVSPAFPNMDPTVPIGWCYCGLAAESGNPTSVSDLYKEPEMADIPCAKEHFRSILSVPLRTSNSLVGVMHVASVKPAAFDNSQRELLTAIGYQLSGAIEKSLLHERLKKLNLDLERLVEERTVELVAAQAELSQKADRLQQLLDDSRRVEESTRAQIANDLHDGGQQLIIGALFEAQAAREAALISPHMAAKELAEVERLLRQVENEMRNAIYTLRPVTLDAHGLVGAIRETIERVDKISSITWKLQIEGEPMRFCEEAELAAFRIVQEALNNVENHSAANEATIMVDFGDDVLRVEVVDNGNGFNPSIIGQNDEPGLGLLGMRERAQSIGGSFETWTVQGKGTRIRLDFPLK